MNLEGIQILLVEDNPADARLFQDLVRDTGRFKLEHVTCLDGAFQQLRNGHVDLVLLDLTLEGEAGLDPLIHLHAHAPHVPIVVLTGEEDNILAVKAVRAGAQDYLVKGCVTGDLLLRSVRYATERGRAVEALERREEHYRSLIENSLDLVSILNFDGTVRYASPSHQRILGYSPDDLVGQNAFSFVHPDDLAAVQRAFSSSATPSSLECRFRHKDGSWRVLASTGRDLGLVPGVRGVVINSRDITERKRLEEQLHHSQRLEAVGRLAGGVAHDFNNLLMVITGYSQMLLESLHPGDPARGDLEQVLKAAKRATDLTHQLLAFSRRQVARPALINLNALVVDMERMLRRVLGEDVELVTTLAPDLKTIRADPGQIEQVILNVAVNARDAMPTGGKLTIETTALQASEEFEREHLGLKAGEYVILRMTDTGFGMDEPVLSRLFEPFFTTKEHGTGLGLSTSYGIIKQSGGDMWVDSKTGFGTTFRVCLPAVERTPDDLEAGREGAVQRGTETILLVEDDNAVRHVVETMLMRQGYRVLSAACASDAVELAEQHPAGIDLLITDVVMPGTSGRQLAENIVTHRPQMKVLYVSGYGESIDPQSKAAFLQKPFTSGELALKIREVLRAG